MAAVLAAGGRGVAAVSHWSAAALWDLSHSRAAETEITTWSRDGRRPGIRVHRVKVMHRHDVTTFDRIPVTTPARTLCDIAHAMSSEELERVVARALAGRTTRYRLRSTLARYAGRPGAVLLRALIDGNPNLALLRSEAEAKFLDVARAAGMHPRVNTRVAGFEVDFLWPAERFIVEVDGFEFHASRDAFEEDRRRDAILAAAGMQVVRVTWTQIVYESEELVSRIRRALAQRRVGDSAEQ